MGLLVGLVTTTTVDTLTLLQVLSHSAVCSEKHRMWLVFCSPILLCCEKKVWRILAGGLLNTFSGVFGVARVPVRQFLEQDNWIALCVTVAQARNRSVEIPQSAPITLSRQTPLAKTQK
jgi:hypothetical protein